MEYTCDFSTLILQQQNASLFNTLYTDIYGIQLFFMLNTCFEINKIYKINPFSDYIDMKYYSGNVFPTDM